MKRVALLGATGSIGRQALDVVATLPDVEIVALAAGRDDRALVALAREHGIATLALADPAAAARARDGFAGRVLEGPQGIAALALEVAADVVLNACVGVAGLPRRSPRSRPGSMSRSRTRRASSPVARSCATPPSGAAPC